MNAILKQVPNFFTCCNLLCGCIGIIQIFKGNLDNGAYMVLTGAFFDFIDGFAARLLKTESPIGKDLDSLADVITFGAAPGFMVYQLLGTYSGNAYLANIGLLIPVFSALRLAKFNIDVRQSEVFYGLPTPANALFFISVPFVILGNNQFLSLLFQNPVFLSVVTIIFSLLLVSEIRLFSLKFKKLNFNENMFPLIFIIGSNILFFTLFFTAIPFIIILYIILSLIKNALNK